MKTSPWEAVSTSNVEALRHEHIGLGNPDLPTFAHKQEIIDALNGNQAVVIVSPTGTGKSTQLPQYALEAGFKTIRQVQPRRRAAENVAQRITQELAEKVGEESAAGLVSFQTGAGLIGPRNARIQIMTDGLMVAKDAYEPTDGTNELWILDEIHEGNLNQWLLMGLAKQKCRDNEAFTVVAMTATADKYKVINFLTDENGQEPAVIELDAKMYPVETRIEQHSDTIRETVKAAIDIYENPDAHDGSNTIILFESGKREIKDTIDTLRTRLPKNVLEKVTLLPGYAKMTPQALAPIYEDVDGIKIVVQTNMGKTSMTIPRTRYVITQGLERQMGIDEEEGAPQLLERPISQDCMVQQLGRAGRTSTGIFVHTKRDGEAFIPMDEREPHLEPEVKRSDIDRTLLYLAARGVALENFDAIDEIPQASLNRSLQRLHALQAITEQGEITAFGKRLVTYPCKPENAGVIVAAESMSNPVKAYAAALVAINEVGGLRIYAPDRDKALDEPGAETGSDPLANLDKLIAIKGKKFKELEKLDIDVNNLLRIEELSRKLGKRAGLVEFPELKPPSNEEREQIRECIVTGYVNSVYLPQGERLYRKLGQLTQPRVISNRSVVPDFSSSPVVAQPRNVEVRIKGKPELKRILEHVTEVPYEQLGRVATQLTEWVHLGYRMRNGKFVQQQQQVLGSRVLELREVAAQPCPGLREKVLEHVKIHPGKHLRSLYKIKTELQLLSHKAKGSITLLTEDRIFEMITDAAPEEIDDPGLVEDNLRQRIERENISLDSFISPEERAKILADAPDTYEIQDTKLRLFYSKGKPVVRKYNPDFLLQLDETTGMQLPDGRDIYFVYDQREMKLDQLKKRLVAEGVL